MKQKLSFVAILLLISAVAYAQSCAPSSCAATTACGPGNTKKGEAKAITELRSSLQEIINGYSASRYAENSTLSNIKLEAGASDDESLLYLVQVSNALRSELATKLPQDVVHKDIKDYQAKPALNKQQLVSVLKTDIKLFRDQIAKL